MLRTPGFTVVAVMALALGIGANTAIFSVVNAVLLRPLPYEDPGRLVVILHQGDNPVAVANYADWRDQQHSFERMAAADFWTPNLTGVNPPEHLWAMKVTAEMFPVLGVEPLMGRTFLANEDQPGHELEIVLSYRLWQRRFAGDRNIIGRSITLDGHAYTVIGVMPPEFKFAPFWATKAELWAPNVLAQRLQNRGGNSLRIFARLRPGVSLAQARSDMATITARLEQQYPGTNRDVRVLPLKEKVVGDIQPALLVLLGAVGFVLLIACANVAHMLLARAAARQREIAVRVALGAGRGRMIRQFLTESLLLALIGAGAGLVLAKWGIRVLVGMSPQGIPRIDTIGLDGRVLLFLLAVSLVTGILFGLAPALQSTVLNFGEALKDGGRGGSEGGRQSRMRNFLVASEFALALMLLIAAGLMIRSFAALQAIDPGFNPHRVLSMVVSVAGSAEADPGRRGIFYRELVEKVRRLPGVEAASGINHLPLAGDLWGWPFAIEGRPAPKPGESPWGVYRMVMPEYFKTMQIPLLRGRDITASDDVNAPGVVVINEAAARRYWPGEDAIGKRISFEDAPKQKWLSVIGVAQNAKQGDWTDAAHPEVYLACMQNRQFLEEPKSHMAYITLVVRSSGDAAALTPAVKEAVWSFDRNLPISQVATMDEVVRGANAEPRFEVTLLAVFAGVALTLAAVGIYGVMSYSVSRRTHEIGIRMSLGASRADVLALVLRQGMALTLAGAVAGLAGAALVARFMEKLLYGVKPYDPATYVLVPVVLGAAALMATYIPARRATRTDPLVALRHE